jgi:hypothetical protein
MDDILEIKDYKPAVGTQNDKKQRKNDRGPE